MKTLIMATILTGLLFSLASYGTLLVYAQEESKRQNDLIFDVESLSTFPITKNFNITGNVWDKICPSNQCQIEEIEYSSYVVIPGPDDTDPSIFTTLYFYVHDNVTNKDLTPLQKKFAERYELSFSCGVSSVKDIIEQGNNTIYKCSSDFTDVRKDNPEKNDHTYYFNVEGTYDTESDTLTATGKYDRQY